MTTKTKTRAKKKQKEVALDIANQDWTAVCVNNMYMNGIHNGIQAAHALCKLVAKHFIEEAVLCWAVRDHTIKIYNGGMQNSLIEFKKNFIALCERHKIYLPCEEFREEQNALNGALTSVVVIVPEFKDSMPKKWKNFTREFWEDVCPKRWAS